MSDTEKTQGFAPGCWIFIIFILFFVWCVWVEAWKNGNTDSKPWGYPEHISYQEFKSRGKT